MVGVARRPKAPRRRCAGASAAASAAAQMHCHADQGRHTGCTLLLALRRGRAATVRTPPRSLHGAACTRGLQLPSPPLCALRMIDQVSSKYGKPIIITGAAPGCGAGQRAWSLAPALTRVCARRVWLLGGCRRDHAQDCELYEAGDQLPGQRPQGAAVRPQGIFRRSSGVCLMTNMMLALVWCPLGWDQSCATPLGMLINSPTMLRRYAWWSPQQGSIENMTGPNALWYGSGNQTRPTSLGNLYLEQGGPGCYAT